MNVNINAHSVMSMEVDSLRARFVVSARAGIGPPAPTSGVEPSLSDESLSRPLFVRRMLTPENPVLNRERPRPPSGGIRRMFTASLSHPIGISGSS